MLDRRKDIIHNFSKWVAMSSARQGAPLRGHKWYPFLKDIDLDSLFSAKTISTKYFAHWHKKQTETLSVKANVPVGWAAKIINMMIKVWVYIACEGNPFLHELIHPPIDNKLIGAIKKKYPQRNYPQFKRLYTHASTIKKIKTYNEYGEIIEDLRKVAKLEGCKLFEIESLWKCE